MSDSEDGVDTPAPASDDANSDRNLIPRDEAQKAFQARDEAKKQARELQKRLEDLESQAAQQSGDLTKQFELKDRKIEDLAKQLAEAQQQIQKSQRAIIERDFSASVLDGVPQSHQAIAREVLEARLLKGQYDLDDQTDINRAAKKAQKELAESHPQLFEEGPVPSTKTTSVSADVWKSAQSIMDIPQDKWGQIPPDVMQRLVNS